MYGMGLTSNVELAGEEETSFLTSTSDTSSSLTSEGSIPISLEAKAKQLQFERDRAVEEAQFLYMDTKRFLTERENAVESVRKEKARIRELTSELAQLREAMKSIEMENGTTSRRSLEFDGSSSSFSPGSLETRTEKKDPMRKALESAKKKVLSVSADLNVLRGSKNVIESTTLTSRAVTSNTSRTKPLSTDLEKKVESSTMKTVLAEREEQPELTENPEQVEQVSQGEESENAMESTKKLPVDQDVAETLTSENPELEMAIERLSSENQETSAKLSKVIDEKESVTETLRRTEVERDLANEMASQVQEQLDSLIAGKMESDAQLEAEKRQKNDEVERMKTERDTLLQNTQELNAQLKTCEEEKLAAISKSMELQEEKLRSSELEKVLCEVRSGKRQ